MLTIPSLSQIKPVISRIPSKSPVPPGTYKAIVGIIGKDLLAGGTDFTLPPCSKESDWFTISDNESVVLDLHQLPEGTIENCRAFAVFLHRKGTRGWRLATFSHPRLGCVSTKARNVFSKKTLQSYSVDNVLGSRITGWTS